MSGPGSRRTSVVVTLTLLGLLAVLAGCGGAAQEAGAGSNASGDELRIAYLRSPSPLTLGRVNGSVEESLEKQDVGVVWEGPFPAFAPAVEAMNAGSVDLTVGSITAATSALAGQGADFVVFGRQLSNEEGEGIVVKEDGSIRSVEDLAGKKIAVNKGGTGEYLLDKAIDEYGLDPEEVERVYLQPPDAATAFEGGQVDAWATWDPFVALSEGEYGARNLVAGGDLGSQNDIVFVVRRDYLDENPRVVSAVFDTLREESERARGDREATISVYREELELPEGALEPLVARPQGVVEPVDAEAEDKYESVAAYLLEKEIVPSRVDIADHLVDIRDVGQTAEGER